jgi:hypothetical protein
MPLIADNQWHPCLIVKLTDGSFALCDDRTEAISRYADRLPRRVEFAEVRWLKDGDKHAVVDFGTFREVIVPVDKLKLTPF